MSISLYRTSLFIFRFILIYLYDIYIYIYIYISVATLAYFCYSCPLPHSVNLSSQPVVRGPKVSHHSCYCVILHCIAQIDKPTSHGVFFFCKQSRYYIICSLVNIVDKIIFFPFKCIEQKRRCSLRWREKYVY